MTAVKYSIIYIKFHIDIIVIFCKILDKAHNLTELFKTCYAGSNVMTSYDVFTN